MIHHPQYLWLEYNEKGFSFQDVEALCSLGASSKGPKQTGHKGIGFKAAFVLSKRPHVLSTYRFFFDEEADCLLPQVTPQLLGDSELPREPPEKGTAIYLPLRPCLGPSIESISTGGPSPTCWRSCSPARSYSSGPCDASRFKAPQASRSLRAWSEWLRQLQLRAAGARGPPFGALQ